MPRRLGDWLKSFEDWTLERSESPTSMIHAVGLSTLSSAVRRACWWPHEIMGAYQLYPNVFFILVAEPGVARKSTTVSFGEKLLNQLDGINMASSACSDSKLIEDLSETLSGAMSVFPTELASFMNVSKEGMYDLLTKLYDSEDIFQMSTRAHGKEKIENPCINFLAATTPQWIARQMPAHAIGGGFASRVMFIFETEARQRRMYYRNLDWRSFNQLEKDLLHDLAWMMEHIEGQFSFDEEETGDWVEVWYNDHMDKLLEIHENLRGYHSRKPTHVHKIAGLYSISERDDKVVTKEHFNRALTFLGSIEVRMPRAFTSVGENIHADSALRIAEFVMERNKVSKAEIANQFFSLLTAADLDQILFQLISSEVIVPIQNYKGPGRMGYRYNGATGAIAKLISRHE